MQKVITGNKRKKERINERTKLLKIKEMTRNDWKWMKGKEKCLEMKERKKELSENERKRKKKLLVNERKKTA